MRAHGRTWTTFGPFNLGGTAYRVLGAIALGGTAVLVWIGVQPPNEKALGVTVATVALLLGAWWLGIRRVFRGPPK